MVDRAQKTVIDASLKEEEIELRLIGLTGRWVLAREAGQI